jgi:inhibitor of cysteine peptidase
VILILLLAGCASGAPKEFTSPEQTISVQVGEQFVITLDSNPTTGYNWEANFDQGFLKLVKSEYKPKDKPEAMVGAGGKQQFIFEALKKGDTQVKLTYKRPWEQQAADTKTFSVSIK